MPTSKQPEPTPEQLDRQAEQAYSLSESQACAHRADQLRRARDTGTLRLSYPFFRN